MCCGFIRKGNKVSILLSDGSPVMQVAKSAASLARLGRRGATHLGIIAPKPASVGKSKLGGLAVLAGKAEKKMAESQVCLSLLPLTVPCRDSHL